MSRFTVLLLTLVTLSATALAQTTYPAGPDNYTQAQPAPSQQPYSGYGAPQQYSQESGYNGQIANDGNPNAQPAYAPDAAQSEDTQSYPPVAYAPAPYPYYAYGYPYYPYVYGGVGIGLGYGGYYRGGYGYGRGGYRGGYVGGGVRGGGGYGGGFHGGGGRR